MTFQSIALTAAAVRALGGPRARQLSVECPGAIDHVMCRANAKGDIVRTEVDRQDFLRTGSACRSSSGPGGASVTWGWDAKAIWRSRNWRPG
jgi:hypothetical protein